MGSCAPAEEPTNIMINKFTVTYPITYPPRQGGVGGSSEEYQDGSLIVKPVSGTSQFGAEISGIDWSEAISPDIAKQVCLLFEMVKSADG